MNWIWANIFAGFAISFLGSLPIGILNVTIVRVALHKGIRSALSFALACVWVELLYSYVAVELTLSVTRLEAYQSVFHSVACLVLLIAGMYYLRTESGTQMGREVRHAFWSGTVLSVINVVAIPFWLLYTSLLWQNHWIGLSSAGQVSWYVAGIGLGTFGALLLFALLSRRLSQRFLLEPRLINRALGLLLLATSAYEILAVFS